MENFSQCGEALTLTGPAGSPGGTTSGVPVMVEDILVVPAQTVDAGDEFQGVPRGVFRVAKPATEAWTECAKVYWDATNSELTTSVGSPALPLVGVAVEATPAAVVLTSDASPSDLDLSDDTITVLDYTGLADKTISVARAREDMSAENYTITEGVDFDAVTDDATTASNIADALDALVGIGATYVNVPGSPAAETVVVTADVPVRGLARLDGAVRA